MNICKFILPCLLGSVFFLSSNNSAPSDQTTLKPVEFTDIPEYLDSLKAYLERSFKSKSYDSLYSVASSFNIKLEELPDSVKLRYRSVCMWFGFLFKGEIGDYRNSLQFYLKAHDAVQNREYLDSLAWFIENVIATIYTRFGDYDKSEYFSQLVEASLIHYHYPELLSRLYTNNGTNQQSFGNPALAIRYFKKGLVLADSLDYPPGIFSNCLGLAEIYLDLKEDSIAQHYLKRASSNIDLLTTHQSYLKKKGALASAVGQHYALNHQYRNSINHYMLAVQALNKHYNSKQHREFAKLYVELAKAYLNLDNQDSTQYWLHQGLLSLLPGYKGSLENLDISLIYKENSFIDLLEVEYDLLKRKYESTLDTTYLINAYACVKAGLYTNDLLRGDLILDPSKLTAIRTNKQLTNSGIEILHQLFTINSDPDDLMHVREMMTRSKSILYNEKIRNQAITIQMTIKDKQKRDSLEDVMLALLEKYDRNEDYADFNKHYFPAQQQLQAITAQYSDIKKPVIQHEDYIEYDQTDSAVFVIVHVGNVLKFKRLGSRQNFQSLLDRLNQYITLKELSTDHTICQDLYQYLIAPLNISIPENLVIIPDGQISMVPFELLKDEEGKFLLEKSIISYEYQFEPYLLNEKASDKPDFVFCLAPSYSLPSPVKAQLQRGDIFELPYAKDEAERIQKIFGKKALFTNNGEKEKCIKELRRARIFHFSGHAIIKPETAYLVLGDATDKDQQLTDREIDLMSNPMDMVVLSACETGLGKWEYGEGIRSLGRSFMEAGAGAAIYSLWNVNDRSTASIMESFYRFLKKGYAKDEALRQAKLSFLRSADGPYSHPFHWAPFIATGDMRPLERNISFWLLIPAAIIVLTSVMLLRKPRTKKASSKTN